MEEGCENLFTIMVASGVTDKTTFTVTVRIVGTVTAAADAATAATAAPAAATDGYDGKKEQSV